MAKQQFEDVRKARAAADAAAYAWHSEREKKLKEYADLIRQKVQIPEVVNA